jgi:hypothetical protein
MTRELGLVASALVLATCVGLLALVAGDTSYRQAHADTKSLVEAIQNFERSQDSAPDNPHDLVPRFLPAIPKCPVGNSFEYVKRANALWRVGYRDTWSFYDSESEAWTGGSY